MSTSDVPYPKYSQEGEQDELAPSSTYSNQGYPRSTIGLDNAPTVCLTSLQTSSSIGRVADHDSSAVGFLPSGNQLRFETRNHTREPSPEPQGKRTPRPPNAWILYRSQKFRELEQSKDPQAHSANTGKTKSQAEISRIISAMWQNEPESVRRSFEALADEKKLEHQKMYPNYRYRPRKRVKENKMLMNSPSGRHPGLTLPGAYASAMFAGGSSALPYHVPSRSESSPRRYAGQIGGYYSGDLRETQFRPGARDGDAYNWRRQDLSNRRMQSSMTSPTGLSQNQELPFAMQASASTGQIQQGSYRGRSHLYDGLNASRSDDGYRESNSLGSSVRSPWEGGGWASGSGSSPAEQHRLLQGSQADGFTYAGMDASSRNQQASFGFDGGARLKSETFSYAGNGAAVQQSPLQSSHSHFEQRQATFSDGSLVPTQSQGQSQSQGPMSYPGMRSSAGAAGASGGAYNGGHPQLYLNMGSSEQAEGGGSSMMRQDSAATTGDAPSVGTLSTDTIERKPLHFGAGGRDSGEQSYSSF